MDVLVTGGAGFIGSNLVRGLLDIGERVRVLDDLSTGRAENLDGVLDGVDLVHGDIRVPETVRWATEGAEVVYHLAALPSVARSVADPLPTHRVNVDGTLNLLQAALAAGVRRVVYASSSSVYGDTPTLPKHEDMPVSPLSPYAASKLAGEAYCRAFATAYGLETTGLRFFNVFGPRQDPGSEYAAVVPTFITAMLDGRSPQIFGDGTQSRDFTFVGNVVQACQLAAAAPPAAGQVMNVGCGARTSLLELVGELNDLLGTRIEPSFSEPRTGDVRHSEAAIARAEELIGYRPAVGVREGLAETVEWFSGRTPAETRQSSLDRQIGR
jgi:UDP-N-acetylglucosamine/UDP-N-acetyl-alpha-D-glucosaminouronate 4-epimerase